MCLFPGFTLRFCINAVSSSLLHLSMFLTIHIYNVFIHFHISSSSTSWLLITLFLLVNVSWRTYFASHCIYHHMHVLSSCDFPCYCLDTTLFVSFCLLVCLGFFYFFLSLFFFYCENKTLSHDKRVDWFILHSMTLGCRRRLLLGVKEDAIGFVSGIDYNIL